MLDRISVDQWQTFVASREDSTPFHHRNWLELITDQYGSEIHIPALFRQGKIAAAVPLASVRTLVGARKLIALPFSDCIRVLSIDESSRTEFGRQLTRHSFPGFRSVVINTDQPIRPDCAPSDHVRHERSLSQVPITSEPKNSTALRRNLKTAEQHGLTIEWHDDTMAMDNFFQLHLQTRQRLGVPVQPKSFFGRLHQSMVLSGLGRIALVKKETTTIAAGVFLHYGCTMTYKYGASNADYLKCRPNEFMMVHAIRAAEAEGYKYFDFGTSHQRQEGLRRFKRKLQGEELPMYSDCLVGKPSTAARDSRAAEFASIAIRNSPPILCRLMGQLLYRYSQ